jgi:hypothetical protein
MVWQVLVIAVLLLARPVEAEPGDLGRAILAGDERGFRACWPTARTSTRSATSVLCYTWRR